MSTKSAPHGHDIQKSNDVDSKLHSDALYLRRVVFIDEQNVSEEDELDEVGSDTWHYVLYLEGSPVSTARYVPRNTTTIYIQRVATAATSRGKGYGRSVLDEITKDAKVLGFSRAELGAQLTAIKFYESLGYTAFGDVYLDANIPHRDMYLDFA